MSFKIFLCDKLKTTVSSRDKCFHLTSDTLCGNMSVCVCTSPSFLLPCSISGVSSQGKLMCADTVWVVARSHTSCTSTEPLAQLTSVSALLCLDYKPHVFSSDHQVYVYSLYLLSLNSHSMVTF